MTRHSRARKHMKAILQSVHDETMMDCLIISDEKEDKTDDIFNNMVDTMMSDIDDKKRAKDCFGFMTVDEFPPPAPRPPLEVTIEDKQLAEIIKLLKEMNEKLEAVVNHRYIPRW